MKTWLKKYFTPFIIVIILALNLWLGLGRLGKFSAVDEPYWTYGRISKFWSAVAQHKWRSTNVNDKPGITVAILGGPGLWQYNPMVFKSIRGEVKTDQQLADMDALNFHFRLPIFLFCTFSLLLFYFFLKKLFNKQVALLGFMFIGLSPILLGISMIINPDSVLWIFLPLSLLSYFLFHQEKNKRYLWASGIFLGLSLLTKYVANILYIFFFILPFLDYIFADEKPELKKYLKKASLNYLTLVAISMATFYILYPATWTHLDTLLKGTFFSKAFKPVLLLFVGLISLITADIYLWKARLTTYVLDFLAARKILLQQAISFIFLFTIAAVLLNVYAGMKPFDLEDILASPKGIGADNIFLSYTGAIMADMYSLIFGISPLILLALIFALLKNFKNKSSLSLENKVVWYFASFILLYYLASSVNNVAATVRYQIALYPLAFIIAAIGLDKFLDIEKIRRYASSALTYVVILVILLSSILYIRPYYFTYASALLPQKYLLNTKDMGDGSWEAANYLNSLPNPQNLVIWSDKGAVCAEFKGTCTIGFSKKDLTGKNFDYFVISAGRQKRSLKLSGGTNDLVDFKKIYATSEHIIKFEIGGRPDNYVKIISAAQIQ